MKAPSELEPDLLRAWSAAWRPLERLSPSVFAETYRSLKEGTTARPGRFSFEGFEPLRPIADAEAEAIDAGRKFVFMKPTQIGGSEIMVGNTAWLATYFPGPILYLISKDDVAKEFARDRFQPLVTTCEPLAKKHLGGKANGEQTAVKRLVDGKITIAGGKSVLNLQTLPARHVRVDEADSLTAQFAGAGDSIMLAERRLDAFALFGKTSFAAWAHPSAKKHGVARLYYQLSDQRRGFVPCPHCATWFWLDPKFLVVRAREGQSPHEAARDETCYVYVAPCCGTELTDAERLAAAKESEQRSTLPPAIARSKPYIGCHTSHLYFRPLVEIARDVIRGLDDPATALVVRNKVFGDVEDEKHDQEELGAEEWRRLALPEGAPGAFALEEVPPEVQFLTAGQDSRLDQLHWTIWGWGHVRSSVGELVLVGWLVAYGIEPGPREIDARATHLSAGDLVPFDEIFSRPWGTRALKVVQAYHDEGWEADAVHDYTRAAKRARRAVSSKGLSTTSRSATAPVTVKKGTPYKSAGRDLEDPNGTVARLNTYKLKVALSARCSRRFTDEHGVERASLVLPHDVGDDLLEQLASEEEVEVKGVKVWRLKAADEEKKRPRAPNHYWDCAIMSYAAATQHAAFAGRRTQQETDERVRAANAAHAGRARDDQDQGELDREAAKESSILRGPRDDVEERKRRWRIGR